MLAAGNNIWQPILGHHTTTYVMNGHFTTTYVQLSQQHMSMHGHLTTTHVQLSQHLSNYVNITGIEKTHIYQLSFLNVVVIFTIKTGCGLCNFTTKYAKHGSPQLLLYFTKNCQLSQSNSTFCFCQLFQNK